MPDREIGQVVLARTVVLLHGALSLTLRLLSHNLQSNNPGGMNAHRQNKVCNNVNLYG